VARDRKRSNRRRGRGGGGPAGGSGAAGDEQPPQQHGDESIHRSDVPGALNHASSDVDEFDAALIAGAGGVPVDEHELEAAAASSGEDELQESGGAVERSTGAAPQQASGAPVRSGNRAIGFLRASWAELQRVQWPDRRQVSQATAVVIGFVAIAGAYLGIADYVAKEFVELIL
jgi:preprotein translocase SecE subunit